jgi:integrase
MAGPDPRGSVFRTRTGDYGIRWPEAGKRPERTGFPTKTAARAWFNEEVAPRLRDRAPDSSITFDAFCDLYLERWGATVARRTKETVEERLASSRKQYGSWTLRELEGAGGDIARWRASLTDTSCYRLTLAMRQALNAAVRWRYLRTNPVADSGANPQPRTEEFVPFTRDEIDALDAELGPTCGPLVLFAAETGVRTNEWVALERRDIDKAGRAVTVRAARPLPPAPHVRDRGARRGRVDLRARARDGRERARDRPHLWALRARREDSIRARLDARAAT